MAAPEPVPVLRPGDRAFVEVEIIDWPHGDMTNVRIAARGSRVTQSLWVPSALLRVVTVHEPLPVSH